MQCFSNFDEIMDEKIQKHIRLMLLQTQQLSRGQINSWHFPRNSVHKFKQSFLSDLMLIVRVVTVKYKFLQSVLILIDPFFDLVAIGVIFEICAWLVQEQP